MKRPRRGFGNDSRMHGADHGGLGKVSATTNRIHGAEQEHAKDLQRVQVK